MVSEKKKIIIRQARSGEGHKIAKIHQRSIHEIANRDYPDSILEAWHSLDNEIHENKCRGMDNKINEKSTVILVAEVENEMAGFGEVDLNSSVLVALYVHPDYERKGVGTALLRKIEKIARKNKLEFLSMDGSLTAEDFYLKNGYQIREYGKYKLRNGNLMKCVKMRKQLTL